MKPEDLCRHDLLGIPRKHRWVKRLWDKFGVGYAKFPHEWSPRLVCDLCGKIKEVDE